MDFAQLHHRQFVDATLQVVCKTLGASQATYYSVDADQNLHDFISPNTPLAALRLYLREMHAVDPLHVRRIASLYDGVVRLDEVAAHTPADEYEEYARFLKRFGIFQNVELLFRDGEQVKAGISIFWTSRDPSPTSTHYRLATELQRYIQFNIQSYLGAAKTDFGRRAMAVFSLTRREADVVDLLCSGHTNAGIAASLGIGVATVKTHLLHIFEKAGVANRSGLIACLAKA
jgi:DNA-binding CsgD family transcriptional regulator